MTTENPGSREPEAFFTERRQWGRGVGLHRMAHLVSQLGEGGLAGIDAVRVTGSKGKGSTVAMTAAILEWAVPPCFATTSPHLFRFRERFRLGGEEVGEVELAGAAGWLREAEAELVERDDPPTWFEAATAAALWMLARHTAEAGGTLAAVFEAGIGGRLDPTRAVPGRVVGITGVEVEHAGVLGDTEELVAYDKAELCPDGSTLVAGPLDPEVRRRLAGYCTLRGLGFLYAPEEAAVEVREVTVSGTRFDLTLPEAALPDLHLPLAGRHQAANAAVAVLLAREWLRRHRPGLPPEGFAAAVREGLAAARAPLRFERLTAEGEEPPVYADLAHTPAAAAALAATVRETLGERPLVLLVGVSANHDPCELIRPLLPGTVGVVATSAKKRGEPPSIVATAVRDLAPHLPLREIPDVAEALPAAVEMAAEHGAAVLVFGWMWVAMEAALEEVEGRS